MPQECFGSYSVPGETGIGSGVNLHSTVASAGNTHKNSFRHTGLNRLYLTSHLCGQVKFSYPNFLSRESCQDNSPVYSIFNLVLCY